MNHITVAVRVGAKDGPRVMLLGRNAWAVLQLIAAGPQGVTPIEHVGPRWSAYVYKLRKAGIAVVTIRETHGGQFPGHHARYALAVPVFIEEPGGVAA